MPADPELLISANDPADELSLLEIGRRLGVSKERSQ